jgi:hypothetical protein
VEPAGNGKLKRGKSCWVWGLWFGDFEHLLCLPRTCIRDQGFVGCSWGDFSIYKRSPVGLGSSFLSGSQTSVLDTCSFCILPCLLPRLVSLSKLSSSQYISEDSSICLYIQLVCIV